MSRPSEPTSHRQVMRRQYPAGPHLWRLKVRPRQRLLEHALRLGFTLPDADDLVQAAYILLLRLPQRDEPIRDWFGFLAGCVQKSGLSARTRERRRYRILGQRPPPAEVDPSPEDWLVARCMVERILNSLSLDDADLFRWRFLEELTPREIAERLGIAEGAVWMRLQRALRKARDVIGIT